MIASSIEMWSPTSTVSILSIRSSSRSIDVVLTRGGLVSDKEYGSLAP